MGVIGKKENWNTGILEYYNTWNIIPGIMKLLGFLNLDLLAINL